MPTLSLDRAAMAIAEADFFGDEKTCSKYKISRRSLQRWRQRTRQDSELACSVAEKKQLLLEVWQIEATKPLSVALEQLTKRMPLAKTAADARMIYVLAGVVKTLGELKLSTGLLLDD